MKGVNLQTIRPETVRFHPAAKSGSHGNAGVFRDLLEKTMGQQEGVRFSSHAVDRLRLRNITLSPEDIARLNAAVGKAENKGSRDSLVLMNGMAFVVNINNKTIVTAMTNDQMQDRIITNIDSTVLA